MENRKTTLKAVRKVTHWRELSTLDSICTVLPDGRVLGTDGGVQVELGTLDEDEMTELFPLTYTYSIFDSNPCDSSGTEWEGYSKRRITASDASEVAERVQSIITDVAANLSQADGYTVGQTLYALVWDSDGTIVHTLTHEITYADLGLTAPMSEYDALEWAEECTEGDYLAEFADSVADSDDDSSCGYREDTLARVRVVLAARVLTLRTDDIGLVVQGM